MRTKRILWGTIGALLAAALLELGLFAWPHAQNKIITAAYVPSGYYLPILIADENGYFRDAGYTLKLQRFNNNALMISSFINGNLDLTAQSALTMFPVEVAHAGTFKYVYGQFANSYFFLVPSNSKIGKLSDLRGRTIGTWQSATAVAFIKIILSSSGLSESDYKIVRYNATDVSSALVNGNVDAVFLFDAQAENLVQNFGAKYLDKSAIANIQTPSGMVRLFNGGAMINSALIKSDPQMAQAIQSALLKAINYINQQPVAARVQLNTALNIHLRNPDAVQLDVFQPIDGTLIATASDTAALMAAHGLLSGAPDVSQMFWTAR
jgi:NitT/TauT family transport system substrate-binding protein